MADKKQVKQTIKQLQRIKTWQLVILFILASFVAATFLRLNNIGMVQRRNAVLSADQVGDETATIERLSDLQQYVSAHMNTSLGKGVFLQSSYDRALKAAQQQAGSSDNPYGNIYEKAQEVCAPQFTRYSTAYLDCTMAQLAKYPGTGTLQSQINIPWQLYMMDYASPLWSPDFAGWSVVVCIVIGLMIVIRIITMAILRIILKRRYKSI